MKLEDQVCALELAKKLKELGVKQKSVFYYGFKYFNEESGYRLFWPMLETHEFAEGDLPLGAVSAFTVAELGEMLPEKHFSYKVGTSWFNAKNYRDYNEDFPVGVAMPTEADARAKMLIHLIEKGIVKL